MPHFYRLIFAISLLNPVFATAQMTSTEAVARVTEDAELREAERRALAEDLVAGKESPGREFEPRLRQRLIAALAGETVEQLRARQPGHIASTALGDSKLDMVYNRFAQPCRIIDTRIGAGPLNPGFTQSFKVAGIAGFPAQGGTPNGCGVPIGATAAMINFVAVNPTGAGNLRGAAYPDALPPVGSIINYQLLTPNLNVANGVAFPICDPVTAPDCDYDMKVQPNGAAVHLVADVLGYFSRFPVEKVRSFIVQKEATGFTSLPDTPACTAVSGLNVTVTAPTAGKVWVHGSLKVSVDHQAGQFGNAIVYLNTAPGVCESLGGNTSDRNYTFAGSHPVGVFLFDLSLDRIYPIAEGATVTYYVNGHKSFTADSISLLFGTLTAQFIPD